MNSPGFPTEILPDHMLLYRITRAIYADKLVASGIENRWNHKGSFVIYTASSASLACLENLVHTSGKLLYTQQYRLVVISIATKSTITKVSLSSLPKHWQDVEHKSLTQNIGDKWYESQDSLLLQIPSAIVSGEHNFIIHTLHPDFKKVKIIQSTPFLFDQRLKSGA